MQQNNSETVTNKNDKEITKERYTSLQKKDKKNDNIKLIIVVV